MANEKPEPKSYVARKECGCLVAACVDLPECRKETAKFVAKCIRDGLTVELMATAEVRAAKWGWDCDHKPAEVANGKL